MHFRRDQEAIGGRLESQNIKSDTPERSAWAFHRARVQKKVWGESLVALD